MATKVNTTKANTTKAEVAKTEAAKAEATRTETAKTEAQTAKKTRKPRSEWKKIEGIVRGRMPKAVVKMVRFSECPVKDSKWQTELKTTAGKIYDIMKMRNFKDVVDVWKPTKEEFDEGLKWLSDSVKAKKEVIDLYKKVVQPAPAK